MSDEFDDKYKKGYDPDEEGESGREGESGDTGSGSGVQFHWDTGIDTRREDVLSPQELKRILGAHKEIHKGRVDKQKSTRQERQALKEGKIHLPSLQNRNFAQGMGHSNYKKHPISFKAQFSGIDKQMATLPSQFDADTNDKLRNELENRYDLRLGLQHAPKFTPPTLRRM